MIFTEAIVIKTYVLGPNWVQLARFWWAMSGFKRRGINGKCEIEQPIPRCQHSVLCRMLGPFFILVRIG